MRVTVRKGEDLLNPIWERDLMGRSLADEAAPTSSHIVQRVTSDEGLRGASIEEHRTSVRRNGAPSAMYCNLGSERSVVQRHGTPDAAGAVFWKCTA